MKTNKKYFFYAGIVIILIGAYFVLNNILFDGIKPEKIKQDGFVANYFAKEYTKKSTAVIMIGGGEWGDYWGLEFAKKGFVGLSLPYTRNDGLPKLPEEIPLEYFERAIKWLREQPEVNPEKIVVMGASRNGELALIVASTFHEFVSGVVAYAPSSVSWSNTVLPYNSNTIKASWKYKGENIPYVPMDKISGGNSTKINTLKYWESGLNKTNFVNLAAIKVENINGPILLFSGKDDKVWPSSRMADMIEERIKENNFQHSFKNIQYLNAGHLISSNPESKSDCRTGRIIIDEKEYELEYGGTPEGDSEAKKDAKIRALAFIENL